MKRYRNLTLLLAATVGTCSPVIAQEATEESAPAQEAAAPADPATVKNDSSYGFGFQSGRRFAAETAQYGITADDIDQEAFAKGFFEALRGEDPSMEEAKIGAAMQALGTNLQEREKKIADDNLEKGKAFLAENAKKEGVVTTESGVQYQILEKGGEERYQEPKEGEEAAQKQFMVNYRGTLIDGTEFDASPEGQPVPMTLQVIPGFQEVLKLMPVGAKWRVWIPSDLAYGEQRRSAEIAPNSVLIFDLELVSIEDAPPMQGFPFPGAQQMPQGAPQPEAPQPEAPQGE